MFQQMANMYDDIKMFSRFIATHFQCTACFVSKMKLSPIANVDPERTLPHTEFHSDLPDPMKTSLGGYNHLANFIQPTLSISDM